MGLSAVQMQTTPPAVELRQIPNRTIINNTKNILFLMPNKGRRPYFAANGQIDENRNV
jgi:hypothetical protein